MIPNFFLTSVIALFLFWYFHFLGRGVALFVFKKVSPEFFSIVGLGLFSSFVTPFLYLFGSSSLACLTYVVILFLIFVIPQYKINSDLFFPQYFTIAMAILAAIIVSLGLYLKAQDGLYTVSVVMLDHLKIGMIDAIVRDGLPVINPFMASDTGESHLHYYMLWYATGAIFSSALNLSGWVVDICLTFTTAAASFMVIVGLYKEINKGIVCFSSVLLIFLICLSGPLVTFLQYLLGENVWIFLSKKHPLETWLVQAAWVPQHLASASLMCFILLSMYAKNSISWGKSLFQGLLISSCFGMSAWVGGVTFCLTCMVLVFHEIWTQKNIRTTFIRWFTPALTAGLVSIPMILNQLGASRIPGKQLLKIGVFPTVDGPPKIVKIICYFTIFLICYFPVAYVATCGYIAKNKKEIRQNPDQQRLLLILASSIIISLFVKSTIANNDLGWRAILPAVLIMSALSVHFIMETHNRWILLLLGGLFIASVPHTKNFARELVIGSNGIHIEEHIQNLTLIKENTRPTDRVLVNTKIAKKGTYNTGVLPIVITDRRLCFTNIDYAEAFSGSLNVDPNRIKNEINDFYNGKTSDLNFLDPLQCDIVTVTNKDPVWRQLRELSLQYPVRYISDDVAFIDLGAVSK